MACRAYPVCHPGRPLRRSGYRAQPCSPTPASSRPALPGAAPTERTHVCSHTRSWRRCRLVLLPYESHSYLARENILHLLYEVDTWLMKYVSGRSGNGLQFLLPSPPKPGIITGKPHQLTKLRAGGCESVQRYPVAPRPVNVTACIIIKTLF